MATNARSNGGAAGYAVAVVILGCLFGLTVVLAAVFKSQIAEHQIAAQEAKSELEQFVARREMNESHMTQLKEKAKAQDRSVVGMLRAENEKLKRMIDQSPTASLESIENQKKSLQLSSGQTLMSAIVQLQAELAAAKKQAQEAKAQVANAQDAAAQTQAQQQAQATEYEQAVAESNDRIAAVQGQFDRFRSDVEAQRTKFEDHLETIRSQKQQVIDELEGTGEQKDQQVALLKQRIEELTGLLPETGGVGPDPTRQPDGEITAVMPEEDLVYISRGKVDQMMLGMTFDVFDHDGGVVVDEYGDLRGYATIEVISVTDNASLARVVRLQRGRRVDEGDLIANLVYDPNTTYKFFVFGKFDIDNTGRATTTDRRRIETIVNKWGGVLARDLSYSTDFLVLGQEPDFPEPLSPHETDPEVIALRTQQIQTYKKYQDLIASAKTLSIPVLNQNRFLALVGYYQR